MLRLLSVGVAVLLLSGCGDAVHGKAIAEPQVALFHDRLNNGQFDTIYGEASAEFRGAAPKAQVVQLFSAIERKLGKVKSASTKTWNISSFNFNARVVLVVEPRFEHGTGTETFTFRVSGGKAVLLGYSINSIDMLTQ